MTLNEVKTFVVGTIKQAFTNKKTLDKFDDSTGTLKYDGQKINNLPVFVADDAPVGNIIAFMGNSAPQDYLICDGAEYNIADYQLLAQHILDEFGSYNYFGGDGTATFAVPDLRGEFLRGTGTATRDAGSGSAVGEHQDGTKHQNFYIGDASLCFYGPCNDGASNKNFDIAINSTTTGKKIAYNDYTSTGASQYFTSRPTNTSVLYCIKYQITQNNISKDIVTYSLGEQCIGSWINGKPLYEKTIKTTVPEDGAIDTRLNLADTTELNIEQCISINGYITSEHWTVTLNGKVIQTWYRPQDNAVVLTTTNEYYIGMECVIVLQYTKTTDTENSFTLDMLSNITTLNTIASDEEVNEVIGGV